MSWLPDGKGVRPGGDVGGDYQATESYSVRYHHTDRLGAVVTVFFYGVKYDHQRGGKYGVETQTELTVCDDRRYPGSTEQWSDASYETGPGIHATFEDAERAAEATARRHRPNTIRWDGRAPWERGA